MDWLAALAQLRAEGQPGVLITVTDVRGHAPREAGAKMVVGPEQTWGTVGGGDLEETAVERARLMIAADERVPVTVEARLNEHAHHRHGQQCCGGEVQLLLDPQPVRPCVAIFGIGHVGYELAGIASRLELQLHLIDSRAEAVDPFRLAQITAGPADVVVHHAVLGELVLERLPAGAQVLVMTHDHAEDFALCDAALRMPRLGGIGLIGSRAKWSRFRTRLLAAGHDPAAVDRIRCPIGHREVDGGKQPAAIAISVAAELLELTAHSLTRR